MKFTTTEIIALAALAGFTIGCADRQPQTTPEIPVAEEQDAAEPEVTEESENETPASESGSRRKYTGISFEIPGNWKSLEAKMIDSKYLVETDKGDIEITLTGMGGGLDANLDRWVKQVRREPNDEPEWSTVNVAGIESKQVDVRGRYTSGVGNDTGTRQQSRLIGIAVPIPVRDFFVKLVGPREAMVEFDDELKAFLKTARRED